MNKKRSNYPISRRRFLQGTAVALAGALLPANRRMLLAQQHQRVLRPKSPAAGLIIADHTVVDQYSAIPDTYIDAVKTMWLNVPGESHSAAYRVGLDLLEALDPRYAVNVTTSGEPEGYTDQYLRMCMATWGDVDNPTGWRYGYGEEDWYTSAQAVAQTKTHLTYANTNGLEIAAMGFAWCWDMTSGNNPGGGTDPVYQVRWAGSSVGGPEGDLRWGLDAEDQALTGNSVCMDTYLNAVDEYNAHCQANGYPTRVFFTTGPVDSSSNTGENGYQRYLKHQYMRNYVQALGDGILFDYADILTWGDDGTQNTVTWTDYGGTEQTFPFIHPDNLLGGDVGHIGEVGALRLGKALWWMLARMAGWEPGGGDSEPPSVPTGLSATAISFTQVDLNWNPSTDNPGGSGVAAYHIYRDGVQVGTTPASTTSYSDLGLAGETQYAYSVAARDGAGNLSDPCEPVLVTTPEVPYRILMPLIDNNS
jgi:hypothetical protein